MISSLSMESLDEILNSLQRIEQRLDDMEQQRVVKEFYSTAEVAAILGKAEWTVREWCRNARVHAEKRPAGRGPNGEWMISHEELLRLQNEGLLPNPLSYRHVR